MIVRQLVKPTRGSDPQSGVHIHREVSAMNMAGGNSPYVALPNGGMLVAHPGQAPVYVPPVKPLPLAAAASMATTLVKYTHPFPTPPSPPFSSLPPEPLGNNPSESPCKANGDHPSPVKPSVPPMPGHMSDMGSHSHQRRRECLFVFLASLHPMGPVPQSRGKHTSP